MLRALPDEGSQSGSALVISIFFLLLLATLALTGLRASTTNVQIVGNMQARQEVTAAAQMLLEQTVSTDEFVTNRHGVFAAARVVTDYNGDGEPDAVAVLAAAAGVPTSSLGSAGGPRPFQSAGCTLLCECSLDQSGTAAR